MGTLTFEKLPEAVELLLEKLAQIEQLLSTLPHLDSSPERLSAEQAADYVNLAVSTIYNKVCLKEIPGVKKGKHLYFYKSELDEWVRQGRKIIPQTSVPSRQLSRKGRNRKH